MENDKILLITSGQGPVECCRAVALVLKKLIDEAKKHACQVEVLNRKEGTHIDTVKSAIVKIKGKNVDAFLGNWLGTICWISDTTNSRRRKNWYIGIAEIEKTEMLEINEKDISFQTMRSSGKGGQHVNKVNTAVRAIHKPLGIQSVSMDSRSQHRNKEIAIKRLKEKIYEMEINKIKQQTTLLWENHKELERGNPIKTFTGKLFKNKRQLKNYKSKRQKLKIELKKELWE